MSQIPEPEQLINVINNMIENYQQTRSPLTALSIFQHLQTLCSHPDYDNADIDKCGYLRLMRVWRWLAKGPADQAMVAV